VYAPDLSVTKVDSSDPVEIGNTLTYTLTIANNGSSEATEVRLSDILPNEVTLSSATPSQGTGCGGTSTISCTLGTLANGASATVTIVVTPTKAGLSNNAAFVIGKESDSNWSNNWGTEYTNIFTAPVTTTVESALGGTLIYTDTQGLTTTVEAPPNAVTQTITLTYAPIVSPTHATPNLSFAGHAFTLEAYQGGNLQSGFVFSRPVTVTIHYSAADVAEVMDESNLTLDYWDSSQWVDAATTCTPTSTYDRHPDANWLAVPICHLSEFALLGGQEHRVYLPCVLKNY
jgi:uncharacterized repeat protein (TIGR01451 family)